MRKKYPDITVKRSEFAVMGRALEAPPFPDECPHCKARRVAPMKRAAASFRSYDRGPIYECGGAYWPISASGHDTDAPLRWSGSCAFGSPAAFERATLGIRGDDPGESDAGLALKSEEVAGALRALRDDMDEPVQKIIKARLNHSPQEKREVALLSALVVTTSALAKIVLDPSIRAFLGGGKIEPVRRADAALRAVLRTSKRA